MWFYIDARQYLQSTGKNIVTGFEAYVRDKPRGVMKSIFKPNDRECIVTNFLKLQ